MIVHVIYEHNVDYESQLAANSMQLKCETCF